MKPDFWGIFHDGVIAAATGAVPGRVQLTIQIPYLREMFPGQGDCFQVTLEGCSVMAYQPFDQPETHALEDLSEAQPIILYMQETSPIVLDCTDGNLTMKYDSADVSLDTGEPVGYAQLAKACEDYWDRWQKIGGRA